MTTDANILSTRMPLRELQSEFLAALYAAGVLYPTGVDGVYGRSRAYERICQGVQSIVAVMGGGRFEGMYFPPVLARSTFDRTGYLSSFPDLMGSVHVFHGDDGAYRDLIRRFNGGENWEYDLEPAEVVLSSAACHAVYPLCRGRLPDGGRRIEILGYCFRHEVSPDPLRMQAFRMHELVFVGDPQSALRHRDSGLEDGLQMLTDLGLEMDAVAANDPFFGRVGALLAKAQLQDALKIEGVTQVYEGAEPTAIMSANYAQDHFGVAFEIETVEGDTAHTSCVAFGIDRIVLSLLNRYGFEIDSWPADTQRRLWG